MYNLVVKVDSPLIILHSLDGVDQVQVQWRQFSPDGGRVDWGRSSRAAQAEVVLTFLISGVEPITTGGDC